MNSILKRRSSIHNLKSQKQKSVDSQRKSAAFSRRSKSIASSRKLSLSQIKWENQQIEIHYVKDNPQLLFKQRVYVEIFSGCSPSSVNLSDCNDDSLLGMGASIMKKFNRNLNFIVWQYGYLSTLDKANEYNIKVVNPLWINECLNKNAIADPNLFPVMKLSHDEVLELQKKEKGYNKIKKNQEKQSHVPQQDIDQSFFLQDQLINFRQEIKLLLKSPKSYYVYAQTNIEQNNSIKQQSKKQVQFEQIIEVDENEENKNSKRGTRQQTLNQNINQTQNIAFHKSCNNNLVVQFQDKFKDKFVFLFEDYMRLKADLLIINPTSYKYDLVLLNSLINNKQCQIINQKWLSDLIQNELSPYNKYIVKLEVPKIQLQTIKFSIYQAKIKTQHEKTVNEQLRKALEQIIKYHGGQIVKQEYCETILVLKHIHKNSIKDIRRKHPDGQNLIILDCEWLYKCIQEGKLVEMDTYAKV